MKEIICKIFGHRVTGLNTKRHFAWCKRCDKGLKVSYDMSYGDTLVVGDYGSQKTFCWCECGNELCSTDSHLASDNLMAPNDIVYFKCSKCGDTSEWNFGAPIPFKIKRI